MSFNLLQESPVEIRRAETGVLGVCCYILSVPNQNKCLIVDPGGDALMILSTMQKADLTPEMILLTHSHYDHIGGVEDLVKSCEGLHLACHSECSRLAVNPKTNGSLMIISQEMSIPEPDVILSDDEVIDRAGMTLRAIHLPGHSQGHMVYYLEAAGALFSGDTIFAGAVGRTDLLGGDHDLLMDGIVRVLESLPDQTVIYPGHGPSTTVARELKSNPFLS